MSNGVLAFEVPQSYFFPILFLFPCFQNFSEHILIGKHILSSLSCGLEQMWVPEAMALEYGKSYLKVKQKCIK